MSAIASLNATFLVTKVAKATRSSKSVKCVFSAEKLGKSVAAGALALTLATSANAATVKLGSDSGGLVFEPANITISKGETVTFLNNRGFPHNVVFDEDNIPAGADADAMSHEDYLNGPGDEVSNTFTVAGTYGYYCEPHQGAGMVGQIIVN